MAAATSVAGKAAIIAEDAATDVRNKVPARNAERVSRRAIHRESVTAAA